MKQEDFEVLCTWADKYKINKQEFPRNLKELDEIKELDFFKDEILELPKEILNLENLFNFFCTRESFLKLVESRAHLFESDHGMQYDMEDINFIAENADKFLVINRLEQNFEEPFEHISEKYVKIFKTSKGVFVTLEYSNKISLRVLFKFIEYLNSKMGRETSRIFASREDNKLKDNECKITIYCAS